MIATRTAVCEVSGKPIRCSVCNKPVKRTARRRVGVEWRGEQWWCGMSDGSFHCDDCCSSFPSEAHRW